MAPRNSQRDTDDDAPWLAEAPPPPRTEVSRRSLFWTLFIVLALATVAAVGLILLMSKKDGGSTQGYMNAEQAPVITAEPGPYKIKPADPAGMPIEGIDGTMYTAGEGIDQGSAIDPSLAPEAPLPRPGAGTEAPRPGAGTEALRPGAETGPPRDLLPESAVPAAPAVTAPVAPPAAPAAIRTAPVPTAPVPAPPVARKPAAAAPVPAKPLVTLPPAAAAAPKTEPKPEPKPGAKAGAVQLGAFSSEDKANAAWGPLAARHGLTGKRIVAVESGGRTLYRLRAASADPEATCARLKAAGDACAIVE